MLDYTLIFYIFLAFFIFIFLLASSVDGQPLHNLETKEDFRGVIVGWLIVAILPFSWPFVLAFFCFKGVKKLIHIYSELPSEKEIR